MKINTENNYSNSILEVQSGISAGMPPYFSKSQKLFNFMIAVPKTASNYHFLPSGWNRAVSWVQYENSVDKTLLV